MRPDPSRKALVIFATGTVVAFVALGWYLNHRADVGDQRQRTSNARAAEQAQAMCGILSTIPDKPLDLPRHLTAADRAVIRKAYRAIDHARTVYAPSGRPHACEPLRATPPLRPSPSPTRTVVVVPSAGPSPSRTASPRPTRKPSPHPTHSPSPTPSPTPTCSLQHILRCLEETP